MNINLFMHFKDTNEDNDIVLQTSGNFQFKE